MNDITIKINHDKIGVIFKCLAHLSFIIENKSSAKLDHQQKSNLYILEKFRGKHIKKIFSKKGVKTDFKLKMEYPEALCLHGLLTMLQYNFGFYEQNAILQICNEIHRQL